MQSFSSPSRRQASSAPFGDGGVRDLSAQLQASALWGRGSTLATGKGAPLVACAGGVGGRVHPGVSALACLRLVRVHSSLPRFTMRRACVRCESRSTGTDLVIVSRIETAGQILYHTSAGIPGSRTESASAVNNEGTAEAVPTHRHRIGCQDNGLRKRQRRSRSRDPTMCPTAVVGPGNGRDNPSRYRRYAQRQCRWQGSRSSPWRRASLAA